MCIRGVCAFEPKPSWKEWSMINTQCPSRPGFSEAEAGLRRSPPYPNAPELSGERSGS